MTHHPSFGSNLKWDPAGGTVYVAVGQVGDIAGPGMTRGDIDVTDHDSASGWREFIPGLTDGGVVTFPVGFDPTNTAHTQGLGTGLIGDFDQDGCDIPAWQLTLPPCSGTAIWTWDGYVNAVSPTYAVEGQMMHDISIKVSGKPLLTVT